MPDAICKVCGETTYWRAQRGTRLADYKCKCGGELKRKDIERKKLDRITGHCALCGRRRSVPGGGVILSHSESFQLFHPGDGMPATIQILPAGAMICWSHSPDYPVFVSVNGEK